MGRHDNKPPQPAMKSRTATEHDDEMETTRAPEQQRPRMTDDSNTHHCLFGLVSRRSGLLSHTARWVGGGQGFAWSFRLSAVGKRLGRMQLEVDTPPAYGE